jgi:hypothetical protein
MPRGKPDLEPIRRARYRRFEMQVRQLTPAQVARAQFEALTLELYALLDSPLPGLEKLPLVRELH